MIQRFRYGYRLLLFWGVWLLFLPSSAQKLKNTQTTINGSASFAIGKEIRVIAFSDMITHQREVIALDTIAADGTFHLSFPNMEIRLVQIAIQTSKAEFYAEPDKTYDLTIDMDPQLFNLLDPMEYGGYLQIKSAHSQQDINYKIARFDYKFNDLIDYFAPTLLSEITQSEVDSIYNYLTEDFPLQYEPTHFFKSYCFYSYAILEKIINQKHPDSLYNKYFNNEYVLYNNPAYVDFFNDFYDLYIYLSPKIDRKTLVQCINNQADYWELFNLVGCDSLLVNQRIRELVILQNLHQLYWEKEFNKKNILSIIRQLSQTTHIEEHKKIAENILFELEQTGEGAPLPPAHFKDISGIDFNFEQLKGRWVFVQLFNSQCTDCIREMAILQKMNEKYGEELSIVSLSLDFNRGSLLKFKDQYPQFDWIFVHFNNEYEWLEQMAISTLPDNLLINPEGKLQQRYAADISRDLAQFLSKLFTKEEPEINPLIPQSKH